ncbi:O-methyltransferase COMT-type [Parasponia andersonii]|uniref:O-methyltransferase COMT-type n=1 Tax=Parasponia andersonii TaxID=3476 RepID=A0A2P5AMJ4_PARAD|nr:O-methyltransferase COMT-type [Parasponia andersonii]
MKRRTTSSMPCNFGSSSVLPMVLKAAVELGLLEIIERAGPGALLTPAQIASELPTQNPDCPLVLDRLLRLLSGFMGLPQLPSTSLGMVMEFQWHLYYFPCRTSLTSLVDVGGGDDTILNMIISKYPSIKGFNFDLATILDKSPHHPGIKHCSGDMFASIPKGDAICMKVSGYYMLGMTNMVILGAPETSLAARSLFQFDLFVMNTNITGKERTAREFEGLAKEAGFSQIYLACSAYNFSVVELCKRA